MSEQVHSIKNVNNPNNYVITDSGTTINCLNNNPNTKNDHHTPFGVKATNKYVPKLETTTKADNKETCLPAMIGTRFKCENIVNNILSTPILSDNSCHIHLHKTDINITK